MDMTSYKELVDAALTSKRSTREVLSVLEKLVRKLEADMQETKKKRGRGRGER